MSLAGTVELSGSKPRVQVVSSAFALLAWAGAARGPLFVVVVLPVMVSLLAPFALLAEPAPQSGPAMLAGLAVAVALRSRHLYKLTFAASSATRGAPGRVLRAAQVYTGRTGTDPERVY